MTIKPRSWQKKAFNVIDSVIENGMNTIIPVNACVGSGKTHVACYAFGKFITEHKSQSTVQMFVSPRIRLCDQQSQEISDYIELVFGLIEGTDYKIVPVDCTKQDFNKKNDTLVNRHTIFVICDKSLWGTEPNVEDLNYRWHNWLHNFNVYRRRRKIFGFAAFDEAHNFNNNHDKIESEITKYFTPILMSGTPAPYQKELTSTYSKNICVCSPSLAMKNKWICKPSLNLIFGGLSVWPAAIVATLNREIELCRSEKFNSRIMVNCGSIDVIKALIELPYFQENIGKKFHMITLHSKKSYEDEDFSIQNVEPTIDLRVVSADEAYDKIENIDNNTAFNDDLPILVAQVQMLGEGINVKSFNAIITASNNDKTAMQQIGRCVRNYTLGNTTKVNNGHANVYVLTDNVENILNLMLNLEEYDLTDDCFDWGKKVDLSTGSSDKSDETVIRELSDADWDEIDEHNDLSILELLGRYNKKKEKQILKDICDTVFADDHVVLAILNKLTLPQIKVLNKIATSTNASHKLTESNIKELKEHTESKVKEIEDKNTSITEENESDLPAIAEVKTETPEDRHIASGKQVIGGILKHVFNIVSANKGYKKGIKNRGGLTAMLSVVTHNSDVASVLGEYLEKNERFMNYILK